MNVVFIVMDTVRKDFVSPFNEEVDYTENIERIAEDGKAFHNAVSQAPWTLPSHGSMFTGLYPWEHGATQTNLKLEVEEDLLAEKLRTEGYRTGCFSANPFISESVGTADGFEKVETSIGMDRFDISKKLNDKIKAFEEIIKVDAVPRIEDWLHNLTYHLSKMGSTETEKMVSKASSFIDSNRDEDFFLFMNFMDCHLPLFPEKEYKERHAPDVNPGKVRQYPHRLISQGEEPDSEALRKLYRAQMDYLDDQIGELEKKLKEEGLKDETMFVIVGDHGENLGEEGLLGHSFSVSESLVSVPLVVNSPEMDSEDVEKQVELRELHDLVLNQVGLKEDAELGTKRAKGGMDRPEMDLAKISPELRGKYDEKLYYVRTPGKKVVRSSSGSQEEKELKEGSESRFSVLKKEAEKLENSFEEDAEGKKVESMDEEIKHELKNLGYMQKD